MVRSYSCLLGLLYTLAGCSVLVDKKLDERPSHAEQVPGDGDTAGDGDGDGDGDGTSDAGPGEHPDGGPDPSHPTEDAGPQGLDRSAVTFSIGYEHACGLFPDGHAKCWGRNDEKQRELPPGPFLDLSCGDFHTCVISKTGGLQCVGRNRDGQRVTAEGPYTQVAAGDAHSCALKPDGKVDCWGNGADGQTTPPADVAFTQLTAGERFSCGIRKSDSKVQCWGLASSNRTSPPNRKFLSIDAGSAHGCGVTSDKEALCWGELDFAAPPYTNVIMVAAGNYLSCALLGDHSAHCWGPYAGENDVPFSEEGPYLSVSAGPHANCFITATKDPDCYSLGNSELVPAPPDFFSE